MAKIIKGKYKGEKVQVEQFCDNWISVSFKGQLKKLSVLSVQLDPPEIERFIYATGVGMMWTLFTLSREGIFNKRIMKHVDGPMFGRLEKK